MGEGATEISFFRRTIEGDVDGIDIDRLFRLQGELIAVPGDIAQAFNLEGTGVFVCEYIPRAEGAG